MVSLHPAVSGGPASWNRLKEPCSPPAPPPLTLPGEPQIQMLASRREKFFNGLFLPLFQNHPEALTLRIQLQSEELVVNLERNE